MALPFYSRGLLALAAATLVFFLAGCSAIAPEAARSAVSAWTMERTGHAVARSADDETFSGASTIGTLLAAPLGADAAIRLALLNNPAQLARLAMLDIAGAELAQAGRLRNPGLRFGRMQGGQQVEVERGVTIDLFGLLTLPWRRQIEERRFGQARLRAARATLQLASQTRSAWFAAVAAGRNEELAGQIRTAAEAGAELGREMVRAGNWSRTELARRQAVFDEAVQRFSDARREATAAREHLIVLLGLEEDSAALVLPASLPDLPDLPPLVDNGGDMLTMAMERRLDLMAAREEALTAAAALGLTRRTGLINVFEVTYQDKSASGQPREYGHEVAFELPLFDWGEARVARAQATYMAAVHGAADTAVRARSEVRAALAIHSDSHALARHYRDAVLPLAELESDQILRRYNGMLASVFDLLDDVRARLLAVSQANAAQRDFWLADTALLAAIHGGTLVIETAKAPPSPPSPPRSQSLPQAHPQNPAPAPVRRDTEPVPVPAPAHGHVH